MDRILLLMAAQRFEDAEPSLHGAVENAAAPQRLSVGLVLREAPDEEANARMACLPAPRFIVGPESAWDAASDLWQGETWILLGTPAMRFERRWDRQLEKEARACRNRSVAGAILTGCLPTDADPIAAVCPVAADRFDEAGLLLQQRGMPLRYAAESEPGALIHPGFCFAQAAFWRDVAEVNAAPFWAAFVRRWSVNTLASPVITLTEDDPLPPVAAPEDAQARLRFARHFGIDFDGRRLSAKAREGVWRPGLEFPQRVPLRVKLQEGLRELDNVTSRLTPLVVTCWLTVPGMGDRFEQEMARFRRLCAIRSIPVQCFTDEPRLRLITQTLPNTLEYQPRYGLPCARRLTAENAATYVCLSKPFLLAAAREKDLHHSHYVWMDFGYVRYPVYEKAAVDWDTVCGGQILLARVDGVPDTSMICVPEQEVLPLCRDMETICRETLRETGALPAETAVWQEMIRTWPDRFQLIDLPGRRELFGLTMPARGEEW